MWLTKFLNTMNRLLPSDSPPELLENLAKLNPEKFYIENVRSLLGISHKEAKNLCEEGVIQGMFTEYIEIRCPDGAVAEYYEKHSIPPKTVKCWEEIDGGYEEREYPTYGLEKQVFYRLASISGTQH